MKRCSTLICAVVLGLSALQTSAHAQPLGACESVLPGHYHPVSLANAAIDSVDVWYESSYAAGHPQAKWHAAMFGTTTDAVLTGPGCQVHFLFTRPPNPTWYRLTVSATPKRGVILLHGARGECIWGPAYTDCSPHPTLPPIAEYLTW